MFDKIFGKSKGAPEEKPTTPQKPASAPKANLPKGNPAEAALIAAIQKQKATDPLVGAKIAGKEIVQRLVDGLKNDKGVHVESLFCALGALAGYACQANLRAQAITKGMDPNAPFAVVKTKDGKQYFFGDPLNKALAEDKFSVWSLAAGAAQHAGAKKLPDLNEIFQRTASSLGSDNFGVPKYPGHSAGDLPIGYLQALWPALLPVVKKLTGEPILWPMAYSFAIQEAIEMAKGAISPDEALCIVMEAAVPMSKVDLYSP